MGEMTRINSQIDSNSRRTSMNYGRALGTVLLLFCAAAIGANISVSADSMIHRSAEINQIIPEGRVEVAKGILKEGQKEREGQTDGQNER